MPEHSYSDDNPAMQRSDADPRPRQPPQISLGLLLLSMTIFAVMSAGLFYASRVGAIRQEVSVLTGGGIPDGGEGSRVAHLTFILFTLTSPLLLAGVLSTGLNVAKWIQRRG